MNGKDGLFIAFLIWLMWRPLGQATVTLGPSTLADTPTDATKSPLSIPAPTGNPNDVILYPTGGEFGNPTFFDSLFGSSTFDQITGGGSPFSLNQ